MSISPITTRHLANKQWQLWLEGHPINMKEECLKAIAPAWEALSTWSRNPKGGLHSYTPFADRFGLPKRDSLIAHMWGQLRKPVYRDWLIVWMLHLALGRKPSIDWNFREEQDDPNQRPPIPTIGELFKQATNLPHEWEWPDGLSLRMSIQACQQALQNATGSEWQQAHADWRVIDAAVTMLEHLHTAHIHWQRAIKAGSFHNQVPRQDIQALATMMKVIPVRVISYLYREPLIKAMLTGFFIQVRRSPWKQDLETCLAALRTECEQAGLLTPIGFDHS